MSRAIARAISILQLFREPQLCRMRFLDVIKMPHHAMQAGGTGNAGKTDRVTAYPDACRINNRPAA
jgi:hypothetical protein